MHAVLAFSFDLNIQGASEELKKLKPLLLTFPMKQCFPFYLENVLDMLA